MRALSLPPSSDPGFQPSLWAGCFQPFSSGFHHLGSEVFTRPQYRSRAVPGHLSETKGDQGSHGRSGRSLPARPQTLCWDIKVWEVRSQEAWPDYSLRFFLDLSHPSRRRDP